MKILNGQEAFAALSAGQKIEARHKDVFEFDSLDNFPATVLVNPEYEFRIALTFITIGEMQVPEPVKEAPAKGAQYFAPSLLTEELSKSFKWKNSNLDLALLQRGQVHFEQEHAVIHAQVLIAVSGGSIEVVTETQPDNENEEQPVEANETADRSEWPASQVPSENFIDMWLNRAKDEPTRRNLGRMKASIDHNWDNLDPDHQLQARKIYADFEALVEQAESEAIETDPIKLVEKFTAQISQFTKVDDVLSFRHVFMANGNLDQKDQQHLCKLCEDKVLELDPEQYTPQPEPVVDEASQPSLIDEIDQQATKVVQDKIHKDAMAGNASNYPIDMLYNQKKKMLINRIQEMDSIEALERLAPAIPAAKFNPEDHQELLQIYAERKTAMLHADA